MDRLLLFLLMVSVISGCGPAEKTGAEWKDLAPLPDPDGFAGGYAGVSNGSLLFAGGANFPGNTGPWGTTPKTWYEKIYVLDRPEGTWRVAGALPRKMGYGLSLTTDRGVFCLGGADAAQHYNDAFLMHLSGPAIVFDSLPALPIAIAYAAGAVGAGKIYVAGGTGSPSDTVALNSFWEFDLRTSQWLELPPFPGAGRMLAVAGMLEGKFYLFSGVALSRNSKGEVVRTYLKETLVYDPASRGWTRRVDLPYAVAAAAGPAVAVDGKQLVLVGGDDGTHAHRTLELKAQHPGFHQELLAYDSTEDRWRVGETVPDAVRDTGRGVAVTTPLVIWGDWLVLPSGEVRPGIRTPRIRVYGPVYAE